MNHRHLIAASAGALAAACAQTGGTGPDAAPDDGLPGFTACPAGTDLMDIAVLDANGDFNADLAAVCGAGGASTSGGLVRLWTGDGDGGFAPAGELDPGDNPDFAEVGDLDDDDDVDLAVIAQGQHERRIAVFFNDGDGGFDSEPLVHRMGGSAAHGLVVHDADEDGLMDMIVTGPDLSAGGVLLRNQGADAEPRFSEAQLYPRQDEARGQVAETSYDGFRDLAVPLYRHGKIWMRAGNEDDVLEVLLYKDVRQVIRVLGGGDLNDDWLPDLVVEGWTDEPPAPTRVAMSVRAETAGDENHWLLSDPLPGGGDPRFGFVRDFDGDDAAEIVLMTQSSLGQGTPEALIIRRDGEDYVETGRIALPADPQVARAVDLDGDGDVVLVTGHLAGNRIVVHDWPVES